MAGVSVTKSAELFGVARSNVWKVMIVFEKEGKTSSLKQNSGRKRKLSDRNRRTLRRIVRKNHKNTAMKITAELFDHLEKPVCSKTVRREQNKDGFHERAVIRKSYQNEFEIFRCFHYFDNSYIYIYIYMICE